MESGKFISLESFDDEEKVFVKSLHLLTIKPMFYIANISDDSSSKDLLKRLEDFAKNLNHDVVPTFIKIEQEIALLEDEEKIEYLELMGMDEPVFRSL